MSGQQLMALSIRQPYAQLVAGGTKTVEVRSWRTDYRGELLVCAGAAWADTDDAVDAWNQHLDEIDAILEAFPLGVAVGRVDLVDIVPMEPSLLEAAAMGEMPEGGAWAWKIANPRAFAPEERFPVKGKLRLFRVDAPRIWQ